MEAPLSLGLIVVATDFSPGAHAAFRTAVDLANRTDAALHLIHAGYDEDDAWRPYAPDGGGAEQSIRAWGNKALEAGSLDKVSFESVVVGDGEPAETLLRYVDEHGADLLVAGTHGRRGVRRLLLGSVAERLVRFCSCPVLTVRSSPLRSGTVAPVLVPVDFSSGMPDVLAWAKRMADVYDVPLDLLHVVVEAAPKPSFYSSLQRPPFRAPLDLARDLHQRAREEMQRAFDRARGPHVEVRYHVRTGVPSHEIAEFALDHETGLIVMDTRGLTGAEHLLLGSTTEKTLRLAPCSVLTMRRAAVEDPETGEAVARPALAAV